VADLVLGMNDHQTDLKRLLNDILTDPVGRQVMTHQDRLLRFGAERVFAIGEATQVEVVILNGARIQRVRKNWPRMYWKSLPPFRRGSMGVARGRTQICWTA